MRHPEVLFYMIREHQASLRHEAEVARGIRDRKKAEGSRSVIGNLRVLLHPRP